MTDTFDNGVFDSPRAQQILNDSDVFTEWRGTQATTIATHRPSGTSATHPSSIVAKGRLIEAVLEDQQ